MLLAQQVLSKEKQVKRLKREVRRVRQESEMAVNEMQPQLQKLVDLVKDSKVRGPRSVQGWTPWAVCLSASSGMSALACVFFI